MSELTIYILLASGFSIFALCLLRTGKRFLGSAPESGEQSLESLIPKHYRYFPQIRQALSDVDHNYLREVGSPEIVQKAIRERHAVARRFLFGLREDFSKLERMGRMVAALSPVISREQETERILLSLQFRMLFSLVWLRLSIGRVPLQQIEHLTGMVGRLAVRMEQAMTEINALSAGQLPRSISA